MNFKRLLLIPFGLWAHICIAQHKNLDSLLHELTIHVQEDTTRANIFSDISSAYSNTDPAKGLVMADSAIAIAKKKNFRMALCSAYLTKGTNYSANGNTELALQCFQSALVIANELKSKRGQLRIYTATGLVYANIGDYPKALEHYFKALKICEDTSYTAHADDKAMGTVYLDIGIVYKNLKQYPKSIEFYQRALNEGIKNNDSFSMAFTYSNMGTVYSEMHDTVQALSYYRTALRLNKKLGNKRLVASNLFNIGSMLREANDYINAMEYLQQALSIWKELGNKMRIGMAIGEIGVVYAYAPTKALASFGISEQQRYPTAIKYIQESIGMAVQSSDLVGIYMNYNNLYEIYKKTGKPKEALAAYEHFIQFRDSVLNDTKKEEIEKQKIQYEFDKKEVENKAENDKKQTIALAEIKRQKTIRNTAIAGILFLLVTGGVSFGFYRRKREADFKAQVADTEMKALRAQMNPHFIFNSLNSINDYISRNETKPAREYLSKFAVLMRLILENSEEKEVPLADDLKALEWYMQLEASRMTHGFTYSVNVADDIDPETVLVPPMIMQPFVENSIWHGLSKKTEGGRLEININKQGDVLCCRIEDNGIGRADAQKTSLGKKSLGMKITQSRIDILNRRKKTNAYISMTDLPQGTRAEIKLPLSNKF